MSVFKNITTYFKENFYAEQSRWLIWTPFLFGLGISLYFSLPYEPSYWYSLVVFEITLLLFYVLRRQNLHILFWAILLVEFGFIDIQLQTIYKSRKVEFTSETTQYFKGQVQEISYNAKGRKRLLLQNVENFDTSLKGYYRLTLANKQTEEIREGDCVETVASVFPPSPIPISEGYQLDRKYYYQSISGIGYALSEFFITDCAVEQKKSFKMRLNGFRGQVMEEVAKSLPASEAGVVDAVLLGEQSRIAQKQVDNYRDAGLAHFLSVSGLHLGTIAGLAFFVFRFLLALFPRLALRYEIKKIAAAAAILFSLLYLLISGMAIPAERAFIMTSVVFLGIIFNRQAISMRMVSFAGLVLLIFSPQAFVSVSFQMSFAAVFALIAFYEKYACKIMAWSVNRGIFLKIFFYLAGIVICDFVASVATMPFAIYHFHRVSVYTSLANLLAGPLIGLYLMPTILVCLAALPFGMMYYPLKVLGYGVGLLNQITDYVANLPHSVAYIDSLSFWAFVGIVCGAYWLCAWQRKWRLWGLLPVFIGVISMCWSLRPDMVFAPKGEGIALRDKNGEMLLMPLKTDNWTVSVWRENLHLKDLNKEQKEELKEIFAGHKTNLSQLALECDENKCVYKNVVTFSKQGNIQIEGKNIDNNVGGYIYIQDKTKVVPLQSQKGCRRWQVCQKTGE